MERNTQVLARQAAGYSSSRESGIKSRCGIRAGFTAVRFTDCGVGHRRIFLIKVETSEKVRSSGG
jgi:hypothetical protein